MYYLLIILESKRKRNESYLFNGFVLSTTTGVECQSTESDSVETHFRLLELMHISKFWMLL
jgi:hypothetical protein